MAQKRMFAKTVVGKDKFLAMSATAQALYFHLNMGADDDGFVDSVRTIMRSINAAEDDLRILISKGYLIPFDSGVLVITHWLTHNTLKADRYQPTEYQEERSRLSIHPTSKMYILGASPPVPSFAQPDEIPSIPASDEAGTEVEPEWNQTGTEVEPQNRKDKNREGSSKRKNKDDPFAEFAGEDAELLSALRDFDKMRSQIKAPLTDRAKRNHCKKLLQFPREQWIAIIDQSISNCWKGLFPLKGQQPNSSGSGNIFADLARSGSYD